MTSYDALWFKTTAFHVTHIYNQCTILWSLSVDCTGTQVMEQTSLVVQLNFVMCVVVGEECEGHLILSLL